MYCNAYIPIFFLELWRHQWPQRQMFDIVRLVPVRINFHVSNGVWTLEIGVVVWKYHVNPRPAGGGGGPKAAPCGLSQIAPEVLGNSLWNLPYLSAQQFHTLCQKIRTQVITGQPWVTSEWRHVSPILINKMGLRESPPLHHGRFGRASLLELQKNNFDICY